MTIDNGQVADADEVLRLIEVNQVYAGNGFDSSGSASNSYELTALTAGELASGTYVKIRILCTHDCVANNANATTTAQLKIEEKETGGAYSTILDHLIGSQEAAYGIHSKGIDTIEYYHTITAGEFTNGLQFKITGTTAVGGGSGTTAAMANIQTVLEVKA